MQKHLATGIIAGAFLIGSAGAVLALPGLAAAADPTPTPAATTSAPSATAGTGATTTPSTPSGTTTTPADGSTPGTPGDRGGHRGPGGLDADDLTAAAGALGMTEADLTTALQGGQTVAAVATSKGVDLQKVIDAIVAVGQGRDRRGRHGRDDDAGPGRRSGSRTSPRT